MSPLIVILKKRHYMDQHVREMLRDGIIEPTFSPFSSAAVIAGKKNGECRFCVNYRQLNKATVDAPQCSPRVHETPKDIGTAKIFSTLDLKSGYWQVQCLRDRACTPLSPHPEKVSFNSG